MRILHAAILALVTLAGAAWAQTPPQITTDRYLADLDELIAATDRLTDHPDELSAVVARIPDYWRLESAQGTIEIPTATLSQALTEWGKAPDDKALSRVRDHLALLRSEARDYARAPADSAEARARLNAILSRREFNDVHGQTWQDRLRQAIQDFLIWLLGEAFRSSTIPTIGEFLIYALVVAAFIALAIWVYRSLRKSAETAETLALPQPVSAKEWSAWLAEARGEAERGNWANAIHLAYWAGISLLEAQGAWRPDQARTPREYLRLLPASSEHQPTLMALTRGFEIVWYGGHEADAGAFAETMTHLEKLGCR
jgi:hypothetical protein